MKGGRGSEGERALGLEVRMLLVRLVITLLFYLDRYRASFPGRESKSVALQ